MVVIITATKITTTGLAAEVAKNIVLAGVHSLSLMDHHSVTEQDLGAQFFLTPEDIGKNRAQCSATKLAVLNPKVEVTAITHDVLLVDAEFFEAFDVVCSTLHDLRDMIAIDAICRSKNIYFFAGNLFGFSGFFFSNLHCHSYIEETKETNERGSDTITVVKHEMQFTSLKEVIFESTWAVIPKYTPQHLLVLLALARNVEPGEPHPPSAAILCARLGTTVTAFSDVHLNTVINTTAELSPVAAIVGGILAAEILKAISKKDKPLFNFFLYDGMETTGMPCHVLLFLFFLLFSCSFSNLDLS